MNPSGQQTRNPRTLYAPGRVEAQELRAKHDRLVRHYRQAMDAGQPARARATAVAIKLARSLMPSLSLRRV
jgi:hypothetical protein